MQPLADRLRPATLDDVVGQAHLLGKGCVLRNLIEGRRIPNLIFYGPSGVGKTTVARIIAELSDMQLHRLNGTQVGTADIKEVVSSVGCFGAQNGVLLYLDEIQYLNKKQQQTLLEYIENGDITLIASTTENPYFYVYNAILSRSTVFEFKPVEAADIQNAVRRAAAFLAEESGDPLVISDEVVRYIAGTCGGDVRKAIGAIELCALSVLPGEQGRVIDLEQAQQVSQRSAMKYDREGDQHYDLLSAYQKSMRGSDVDASLHYLARLLAAGDLPSACRRLMVCACEDVGLAYPQIIPIVKAAVDAAIMIGLPEAQIPLSNAVILVASAPKSNSANNAIGAAMADLEAGRIGDIPRNLQNKHFDGADAQKKGQFYLYPHDYPNHYTPQQYLPDAVKDARYYTPGDNKSEQGFAEYLERIKKGKG